MQRPLPRWAGLRPAIAAAVVACAFGQAAAAGSARPDIVTCTPVRTASELNAIRNNLAGTYCIEADIDLGKIANFKPIGTANGPTSVANPFAGRIYGNGHVIRNLTINDSKDFAVGLIGLMSDGLIQDLGLVNANVRGTFGKNIDNFAVANYTGALVAVAAAAPGTVISIARVYVTGQVGCLGVTGLGCRTGAIAAGIVGNATLTDSWSSADVTGDGDAGGLVGEIDEPGAMVLRSYATGNVTCVSANCQLAGGLFHMIASGRTVAECYATGSVTGGSNVIAGGLAAYYAAGGTPGGMLLRGYATGEVAVGGGTATAGSLIGLLDGEMVYESYGTGRVTGGTGATLGGLIGMIENSPSVTNSYWDNVTTGLSTSAGTETGLTTTQLRGTLPPGFGSAWGINQTLSYPYLNDPDGFTSILATLVRANRIYSFLPIGQLDLSQYAAMPEHDTGAALATVYTMIARAVGLTDQVATLEDVDIDKYFWDDATQTTTWAGPVTQHATKQNVFVSIAKTAPLSTANVIGAMNQQKLVILRGTYVQSGGGGAIHYVLGTLYTKTAGGSPNVVVANDPWTGTQIAISAASKQVVAPAGFPLAHFKVDGYEAVAIH